MVAADKKAAYSAAVVPALEHKISKQQDEIER